MGNFAASTHVLSAFICAGIPTTNSSCLFVDTVGRNEAQKLPAEHSRDEIADRGFTLLRWGVARVFLIPGTTPISRYTDTVGPYTSRSKRWKKRLSGCMTTGSPRLTYANCFHTCRTLLSRHKFSTRPTFNSGVNVRLRRRRRT